MYTDTDSECYTCGNVYTTDQRENRTYCSCSDPNLRHKCILNSHVTDCKYYKPKLITINYRSTSQHARF